MSELTSYIPDEKKREWLDELKPIVSEIDKLTPGDKIVGFKQEVIDKYTARKAANLFLEQLIMTDCELECEKNKNEELEYQLANYNTHDPEKLKELRNRTVVVPTNIDEVRKRTLKIFDRHTKNMKALNSK